MTSTRRDVLTASGGALAGLFFTPVPYKLLDDAAIWTQNWSWVPRPVTGESRVRYTACTLCPSGCGVEARCIGTQPVAMAGVAGHPVSGGKLCAIGLGAHQLPYHPARVREAPQLQAVANALAAVERSGDRMAVIDLTPGTADSVVWSRFAANRKNAIYAAVAPPESATLRALSSITRIPAAELAYDWENARTVVSVGAPLLDKPGVALRAWRDGRLRIVQVEAVESRTGALAARTLPSWEESEISGESPSFIISGGGLSEAEERTIAALNLRLGCVGRTGGIVRRHAPPVPVPSAVPLDDVENRSVRLAIVHHGPLAAWPESMESKLADDAVLISLSPYRAGPLERAKYILPTPAYLEGCGEVLTTWNAKGACYGIAPALLEKPAGVLESGDWAGLLDPSLRGARESELKARVAAVHGTNRGRMFGFAGGKVTEMLDTESPKKLWEKFQAGALWFDDSIKPLAIDISLPMVSSTAVPSPKGRRRFGDATVVPPLTSRVPA